MTRGSALSAQQLQSAIAYNRNHRTVRDSTLRAALGIPPDASLDDEAGFARFVADWQEDHIGVGQGDGKLGPKTEAYLGITHPKAVMAAANARSIQLAGNILFDSWGNDVRDNDNDGIVDGASEQTSDGAHFNRVYTQFRVVAGTYNRLGWNHDRTVVVSTTRTVAGSFRYCVCADVVSQAYASAAVMNRAEHGGNPAGVSDQGLRLAPKRGIPLRVSPRRFHLHSRPRGWAFGNRSAAFSNDFGAHGR